MKKTLMMLAIAVTCGMAFSEGSVSVSMSLSHPKENATKTGDGKQKSTGRHGTSTSTEVKSSVFEYEGKISCTPPKDKTATVVVEAYFITHAIGKKGAKDELSSRKELEKFEFGGENPHNYKFTFSSPTITQTTVTTVKTTRGRGRRGGGSSSTDKDKSGERLLGVIVRAMVDGKPVKVVSEPNNTKWISAGKKDVVSLE